MQVQFALPRILASASQQSGYMQCYIMIKPSSPVQLMYQLTFILLVLCSLRLNAPIKVLDTCELLMELVMLKPHLIQVTDTPWSCTWYLQYDSTT